MDTAKADTEAGADDGGQALSSAAAAAAAEGGEAEGAEEEEGPSASVPERLCRCVIVVVLWSGSWVVWMSAQMVKTPSPPL